MIGIFLLAAAELVAHPREIATLDVDCKANTVSLFVGAPNETFPATAMQVSFVGVQSVELGQGARDAGFALRVNPDGLLHTFQATLFGGAMWEGEILRVTPSGDGWKVMRNEPVKDCGPPTLYERLTWVDGGTAFRTACKEDLVIRGARCGGKILAAETSTWGGVRGLYR